MLCSILFKYAISLHSYSGQGTPSMFGDFEAQRHWAEITLHLPISKWYYYKLEYWGLDYPPLTAYHSLLIGFVANIINPTWVALDQSRGFESADLKLYMRLTVLLTDLVLLTPAIWYWAKSMEPDKSKRVTLKFLIVEHFTSHWTSITCICFDRPRPFSVQFGNAGTRLVGVYFLYQ